MGVGGVLVGRGVVVTGGGALVWRGVVMTGGGARGAVP